MVSILINTIVFNKSFVAKFFTCLKSANDGWWGPPPLNQHLGKFGGNRYCGKAVAKSFLCYVITFSKGYVALWIGYPPP